MMFECIDKVYPSVSIDSVSGSIVSFNDEYGGLPLKSCVSQISGYQEGSGTPSPDNVRPLHAFSSGTLTANGNTYTFTFGQSIYQGSIDWKRGVAVGTHGIYILSGNETWSFVGSGTNIRAFIANVVPNKKYSANGICNCFKYGNAENVGEFDLAADYLRFNVYGIATTSTEFNTWITNHSPITVAYELATPITIPLGGINLLTQEGVNNIFCDTGDTTLEYIKII